MVARTPRTPPSPGAAGLDLPIRAPAASLDRVIDRAFPPAPEAPPSPPSGPAPEPLWDAPFFHLHATRAWAALPAEARHGVLAELSRALLLEAFFIEKSGLGHSARMVLLAESTRERMLYARFGADEAAHLHALAPWVPDPPDSSPDQPFLRWLGHVIDCAPRAALVVVIQVVLEGWGLHHYRALADACSEPRLAARLREIVADEALHHGSGLLLHQARPPAAADHTPILDALLPLFDLVRAGPATVTRAMDSAHGGFTARQRRAFAADLGAREHVRVRLDLLRGLLHKAGDPALLERLERRGAFHDPPMEATA